MLIIVPQTVKSYLSDKHFYYINKVIHNQRSYTVMLYDKTIIYDLHFSIIVYRHELCESIRAVQNRLRI